MSKKFFKTLGAFILLVSLFVPTSKGVKAQTSVPQVVYSFYAHLMYDPPVSIGQWVNQGEIIGYTGTTGYGGGGHVHWGVTIYPPLVAESMFNKYPDWGFLDPLDMVNNWGFIKPVPGRESGSCFGCANPSGKQAHHNARDFANKNGNPVYASGSGYVVWNSWWPTYTSATAGNGHGITVFIQHDLSQVSAQAATNSYQAPDGSSQVPEENSSGEGGYFEGDAYAPDTTAATKTLTSPVLAFGFAIVGVIVIGAAGKRNRGYAVILVCFVGLFLFFRLGKANSAPVATPVSTEESYAVYDDEPVFVDVPTPVNPPTPIPTGSPDDPAKPAAVYPDPPYDCNAAIAPLLCKLPVAAVWGDKIVEWSQQAGVDPNAAVTIAAIESCGIVDACSRWEGGIVGKKCTGAFGLFQLTQGTFPELSYQQLFLPEYNGPKGIAYINNRLNAAGGNFLAAAAGYNGGPYALQWQLGSLTRSQYAAKFGEAKAQEVEKMVLYAGMYYEALSGGAHPNFDKFITAGRCSRQAKFFGIPWPPSP